MKPDTAGYSTIFEWDMGRGLPEWFESPGSQQPCDQLSGLEGSAIADAAGAHEWREHSLVQDPTAPVSGPEVHNIEYPAGKVGESSREKIWAWGTPPADSCAILNDSPLEFDEVYIREVRKIWTDRGDGTVETFGSGATFKLSHVKGHWSGSDRGFSFTLNVAITHDQTSQSDFPLTARVQWTDRDGNTRVRVRGHNQGSGQRILVGQWHEIEWQIITNTLSADGSANADGVLRAWIDGVLVMEYEDVKMRSGFSSHTRETFQSYDLVTTWSGGGSDTHTHDKGHYIDHVYVSGMN